MPQQEAEVTRVAMFVEIGGAAYAVTLPPDRMQVLVKLASGLSDTGALPVHKLPEGFEFTTIGEEDNGQVVQTG